MMEPKSNTVSSRTSVQSLDAVPDGLQVSVRQIHCKSSSLRQRLMELGLTVGSVVRKHTVAGGVICEIGYSRFALGRRVCRQIEAVLSL